MVPPARIAANRLTLESNVVGFSGATGSRPVRGKQNPFDDARAKALNKISTGARCRFAILSVRVQRCPLVPPEVDLATASTRPAAYYRLAESAAHMLSRRIGVRAWGNVNSVGHRRRTVQNAEHAPSYAGHDDIAEQSSSARPPQHSRPASRFAAYSMQYLVQGMARRRAFGITFPVASQTAYVLSRIR